MVSAGRHEGLEGCACPLSGLRHHLTAEGARRGIGWDLDLGADLKPAVLDVAVGSPGAPELDIMLVAV